MPSSIKCLLVVAALAIGSQVAARTGSASDDVPATIARSLNARYPDLKILDVRPAPLQSLYEVFTGNQIFYTDKTGDYLVSGSLVDTRNQKDLTAEALDTRNTIEFDTLPFDKAIKVVKGTGKRKLAVFTDPDCPYCREFEKELKAVTDLTVYTFLFPLTQIHPNAERHARAIWCSADRAAAWTLWMHEKKEPEQSACKDAPIEAVSALAQKLRINGTPTLYFETGRRVSHGISATDLEQSFKESSEAISRRTSAVPAAACPEPAASGENFAASCKIGR